MNAFIRLKNTFIRFKYLLLTYRDYNAILNRCATVEQYLYDCSRGKRSLPTTTDCHKLMRHLGTGEKI